MDRAMKAVFALGAVSLMLIALILMVLAPTRLIGAALAGEGFERQLFEAIGFLIVAIAVFDVAKYILEEEVLSDDERRNAAETRRSLTKFGSTIVIAVLLEGLVLVFEVAREDPGQLVWPIALLVTGTVLFVAIAVFQRLSAATEKLVREHDPEVDKTPARKVTTRR